MALQICWLNDKSRGGAGHHCACGLRSTAAGLKRHLANAKGDAVHVCSDTAIWWSLT